MNDNENKNESIVDDDDYEYEKSIAEKNRELKRQHEEAMERAYERQREKEIQAKKERDQKIKNDKIELLRLKEGIIDQDDSSMKEVHEEKIELHGKAKAANIWYHYKWWFIFGAFLIIAVTSIVYEQVTKEKPDITVMMVANNGLADRQQDIEKFLEKYTPDFDENGYVHVAVIMMPQSQNDLQQQGVNNTKLVANLQMGQAIMVFTDENTDDKIKGIMNDVTEDFPDNKHIDKLGFRLDTEKAKKELNYENMPDNTYISLRRPAKTTGDSLETMQKNYDKTYKVFKKIVKSLS